MLMAVHTPLEGELLERLQGVKLVQWVGVGLDCIDLDGARRLGIPVANVFAANAVSVAEYVILAMLYILRRVPDLEQAARDCLFPWPGLVASGMHEARGRTLGILGYGAIGHEVAVRARAFGMEILTASAPGRERPADASEESVGARRVSFDEILETSDVLSLHVPLNPETAGLIGRKELFRMKKGSYLINSGSRRHSRRGRAGVGAARGAPGRRGGRHLRRGAGTSRQPAVGGAQLLRYPPLWWQHHRMHSLCCRGEFRKTSAGPGAAKSRVIASVRVDLYACFKSPYPDPRPSAAISALSRSAARAVICAFPPVRWTSSSKRVPRA